MPSSRSKQNETFVREDKVSQVEATSQLLVKSQTRSGRDSWRWWNFAVALIAAVVESACKFNYFVSQRRGEEEVQIRFNRRKEKRFPPSSFGSARPIIKSKRRISHDYVSWKIFSVRSREIKWKITGKRRKCPQTPRFVFPSGFYWYARVSISVNQSSQSKPTDSLSSITNDKQSSLGKWPRFLFDHHYARIQGEGKVSKPCICVWAVNQDDRRAFRSLTLNYFG